jgi:hypothetical protein
MTNTAYALNTTGVTVEIRGFTASTGLPYTAGAFNTAGLTIQYVRNRADAVSVTPVTQTATGVHTAGGFVHLGAGLYRVDVPNAALVTGADDVVILVSGISDVVFTAARIELVGSDPRTATVSADLRAINGYTVTGNGTSQKFGV